MAALMLSSAIICRSSASLPIMRSMIFRASRVLATENLSFIVLVKRTSVRGITLLVISCSRDQYSNLVITDQCTKSPARLRGAAGLRVAVNGLRNRQLFQRHDPHARIVEHAAELTPTRGADV